VQTSNCYAVLSNLQEALDNLPKTVSPPAKTCVEQEFSSLKKRTIILIGDSHARGISERLASYLNIITRTGISEVKTLDKNVARDNTARGLRSVQQFIQKCAHTNVLILNAPVRFDLSATSYVNRKMAKLIKPFDYAQVVNVNLQRE
jgi:hypothetical protein